MRISASTELPSPRNRRGFTLIEILLVLVILSVVAGLVVISLSRNPATDIDREARRLQLVLSEASEEAVSRGIEITLAISAGSDAIDGRAHYQLLVLNPEQKNWAVPDFNGADQGIWADHDTVEDIELDWYLEGREFSAGQLDSLARVSAFSAPDDLRPSIILLSSGEMTPFRLNISHRAVDYSVNLTSDGFSGVFLE